MKNAFFFLFCLYSFTAISQSPDVAINELCAKNDALLTDPDGEYDDWIELYNNTSSTINLEGYYLSDDNEDKTKWKIASESNILGKGFLIIWADNDLEQSGLHANFKISADGEVIYLSDPSGALVDSVTFSYQFSDISYGRYPDGTNNFTLMNPTFAAPNVNDDLEIEPEFLTDDSDSLYNPDKVVKIEITMDPDDWDFIRLQERTDDQGECPTEPFYSPFEYKSATIKINDHVFENVGIRKKGFRGSIHDEKPSLKIKLDKFVENQEVYDTKSITLNNLKADKSCAKESIVYQIYREAGVKASRCNFAHVMMNGDTLGVYTNIESIKDEFLNRNFGDDRGKLYEGIITDLILEQLYALEAKTGKSEEDRTELHTLISVLNLSNDRLLQIVPELIDMDQYISYWATEVLVNQLDGYNRNGNNYYFYFNPIKSKVEFIPWGVDLAMRRGHEDILRFTISKLPNRLYEIPEIRQQMVDEINHLLNSVWDEERWLSRVADIEEQLTPFLHGDIIRSKIDPSEITKFIGVRRGQIETFLNNLPVYSHEMKPCEYYTGGGECFYGEILEEGAIIYGCENGYWVALNGSEGDENNELIVYPNPALSEIRIKSDDSDYSIYSLAGNKKMEGEIIKNQSIDISSLPKNFYLIKVGDKVFKLMKIE